MNYEPADIREMTYDEISGVNGASGLGYCVVIIGLPKLPPTGMPPRSPR
jgi:hypothetical protein